MVFITSKVFLICPMHKKYYNYFYDKVGKSKLQCFVPFKERSKLKKFGVMSILSGALILIFSCFLVVSICKDKKDKFFKEKPYFLLICCESEKQSATKKDVEKIKNLGGAGNVFEYQNKFGVIINVYKSKEESESVRELTKASIASQTLEVKTKSPSKQKKLEIKKNSKVMGFCLKFDGFVDEMMQSCLNLLAGSVSETEFCKELIRKKLEFDQISSGFDMEIELESNAKIVSSLVLIYINNFLMDYFDSLNKNHLISQFCTNLVLVRVELFNNL